jgi:hypothetical protein
MRGPTKWTRASCGRRVRVPQLIPEILGAIPSSRSWLPESALADGFEQPATQSSRGHLRQAG